MINEDITKYLVHPKHCFCQIDDATLIPWIEKRYVEHKSTIELINSTDDAFEKEVISIVAMLDLDEETMLTLMSDVDLPDDHIINCRKRVKLIVGVE